MPGLNGTALPAIAIAKDFITEVNSLPASGGGPEYLSAKKEELWIHVVSLDEQKRPLQHVLGFLFDSFHTDLEQT